jgi:hypothetical protein
VEVVAAIHLEMVMQVGLIGMVVRAMVIVAQVLMEVGVVVEVEMVLGVDVTVAGVDFFRKTDFFLAFPVCCATIGSTPDFHKEIAMTH